MDANKKFWMVWGESFGPPNVKHRTRLDAVAEATRLARQNPTRRFYVLVATDSIVVDDIQHITLE